MADQRSYIALDWVKEEIRETLKQAQEALEGFVANADDITRLRFCLTYVHQVAGSLTMVELHGASLLAKEVETLLGKMLDSVADKKEQAVEKTDVIEKALTALADYINRVGETHEDRPKELLGIMNEVRAVNDDQEAFSAADVFNPDIAPARKVIKQKPRMAPEEFNELIRKLRQAFHVGLAGLIKGADTRKNLQLINKVCASLFKVSKSTVSQPLWQIAFAISDHLAAQNETIDDDSKKALKLIDEQIRMLEKEGVDGLGNTPESALLKSLLYSVATAEPVTEQIRELREQYQLEAALTEQQQETRRENRVIERLLQHIDSALAAGGDIAMVQVSNALALLAEAHPPAQALAVQAKEAAAGGFDKASTQSLQKELAALDSKAIDAAAMLSHYRDSINASRAVMEDIKEQISNYLKDDFDKQHLEPLPEQLEQQMAALNITTLAELLPVLDASRRYLQDLLASDNRPDSNTMEMLADVISSVDYYLECVIGESQAKLDSIIVVAEQRLESLGCPLKAMAEISLPQAGYTQDAAGEDTAAETETETETETELPVAETEEAQAQAADAPADDVFVLGDEADEEIVEIFIEEGGEVLEQINEYLPQLEADYDNMDALLEVRRSFHTLKGSGRMIGATHIGDFAWSVERMLNKVRDGGGKVTDNCIDVIKAAVEKIPGLLKSLEDGAPYPLAEIRPLIARADAEWEGKVLTAEEAGQTEQAQQTEEQDELESTAEEPEAAAETPAETSEAVAEEAEEQAEPSAESEEQQPIDEELLNIFIAEAETHLGLFAEFLDQINPGYEDVRVTSDLQRALHTLKGSAYMAGVNAMAHLVAPLESFVKDMANFHTTVDSQMLALFIQANELLHEQLAQIKQGDLKPLEKTGPFLDDLQAMHASRIESEEEEAEQNEGGLADKYTALLSQALDCLTEGGDLITEWQSEGLDKDKQEALAECMARLGETAADAGYPEVATLAKALAGFYQRSIETLENVGSEFFELANKGHDELDDMMDIIAAQQVVDPADGLIAELEAGVGEPAGDKTETEPQAKQQAASETKPAKDKSRGAPLPMVDFARQLADADEELLEIFVEETGELMESLEPLVDDWLNDSQQPPPLDEMKRVLHTLKGGARMAELPVLGDLTHAYESRLEQAEAAEKFDVAFVEDVSNYQNQLLQLVDFALSGGTLEQAEAMQAQSGAAPQETQAPPAEEPEQEAEPAQAEEPAAEQEPEEQEAESAEADQPPPATSPSPLVDLARQLAEADEELLDIFVEETGELMESLESVVDDWLNDPQQPPPLEEMKRILHTLKGGARMAELPALGDLTHAYESRLEQAEAAGTFDAAFAEDVGSYQRQLLQLVDFVMSGGTPEQAEAMAANSAEAVPTPAAETEEAAPAEQESLAAEQKEDQPQNELDGQSLMAAVAQEYRNADDETLEIFLEEATELASELEASGGEWLADHDKVDQAEPLKRILHTIKGGARMAELPTLGTLTHDYETMIEQAAAHNTYDAAFFERMQAYQDQIQSLVEFIANGAQMDEAAEAPADDVLITTPASAPASDESQQPVVEVELQEDFDPELLELFVEEAKEQSEGIEEAIAHFLENRDSKEPLEELKRLLHTLKGGARMAGVKQVGDTSHDFETFIINSEREGATSDEAFVDGMQGYHEQLAGQINAISGSATRKEEDKQAAGTDNNVVPIRPDVSTDVQGVSQAAIDATRNFIENFRKEQQRSSRDPVKISPELLDSLINLAGENIIGRSRIEEQISELRFSIDEMDMTVDRLHTQLRRLEIETEAQILFRQEQVVSEGQDNFDPLEMDRYTHMQQLSKSLIEAASDIDDLSGTFNNKMRDMETLLLQQSRINSELQEGLMRCQMVPFSRMVPRLRRIVRQVAQELDKKVEFSVQNAEGELDRSILERMIAPLEHMLRNAVDHGIEMPDVRKKAGKKETGSIQLTLTREGGEVVLTLSDNGGGINLEAVRNKAIERGLMVDDASLSDHEVLQFILHAGFSTAQKVTQISGRGVGMDVVHSEIKQMGGSVEITSEEGKGTNFIVRLPFTVSVNRALMVCIGNDTFAIPLNTIEGIVRVSPYELEAYYQPDAPTFEYAGQSYHLRYMGTLLHRGGAKLDEQTMPLPVILIRSSDYAMAVQVDKLLGSREIVVKSLGPQFSMVEGVSGATVLGDGSVVIILDMLALIRADVSRGLLNEAAALAQETYVPPEEIKATTVMVVDDSVTVRKVTSRLLERFELEVVLAKDGLDAITQLQDMEILPDVMLLDIEMPRMDGFEVLNRVRHNNRLQNIPIVMITSRTGDKHRERALSLGASRYLGKPFQERELLQVIGDLTGADILQA